MHRRAGPLKCPLLEQVILDDNTSASLSESYAARLKAQESALAKAIALDDVKSLPVFQATARDLLAEGALFSSVVAPAEFNRLLRAVDYTRFIVPSLYRTASEAGTPKRVGEPPSTPGTR